MPDWVAMESMVEMCKNFMSTRKISIAFPEVRYEIRSSTSYDLGKALDIDIAPRSVYIFQ